MIRRAVKPTPSQGFLCAPQQINHCRAAGRWLPWGWSVGALLGGAKHMTRSSSLLSTDFITVCTASFTTYKETNAINFYRIKEDICEDKWLQNTGPVQCSKLLLFLRVTATLDHTAKARHVSRVTFVYEEQQYKASATAAFNQML